jgi:hypothetical protein
MMMRTKTKRTKTSPTSRQLAQISTLSAAHFLKSHQI